MRTRQTNQRISESLTCASTLRRDGTHDGRALVRTVRIASATSSSGALSQRRSMGVPLVDPG
ncbi:hypothetical protein [Clavibacter capsici]|uniref:hypothetical protein n=1 Tax=Clavibacter capsici TaxID=1874630 RepID=UPI0014285C0E|nr:hypothetical protein [Clavibacter capsici]QIS38900.1 hypothetical protein GW572_06200 [Clavibacter capsici]